MKLLKAHLSALFGICKLHIQISSVHMGVVPGPALQDAVFKRVYASPVLPCEPVPRKQGFSETFLALVFYQTKYST
jgi:hypothetical protein